MNKPRLEKHIVKEIIDFLRQHGWAVKTHGGAFAAGEPDVSACIRGRSVHFEVKRSPKHEATPLQLAKLKRWGDAGSLVGVVSSVADVEGILRNAGLVR